MRFPEFSSQMTTTRLLQMKMVLTATPQNMYLCLQGSDRMYNKWIDRYDNYNKEVQGIIQLKDAQLIYMTTDLEDNTLDWYNENGVIDTVRYVNKVRELIDSGCDTNEKE